MASRKRLVMVMQRGTPYQSVSVGFRDITNELFHALGSMGRVPLKRKPTESALHFIKKGIDSLQETYLVTKHVFSGGVIELFHVRERRGAEKSARALLHEAMGTLQKKGRKKRRKRRSSKAMQAYTLAQAVPHVGHWGQPGGVFDDEGALVLDGEVPAGVGQ